MTEPKLCPDCGRPKLRPGTDSLTERDLCENADGWGPFTQQVKCARLAITRLRCALEASQAEVERLKSDLDLCKVARQMLADDMRRLGDGEAVKLDIADRVRHRIDLLRQRIVELEAPSATSAELAAAEHAVVEAALSWHAVPADTGAAEKALDDCCERVSRLRSRT